MKFDLKRSRLMGTSLKMSNTIIDYTKGIEIGIPMNIFQNIFTNNHYGKEIMNPELFILQFLIGFYTYGKDRYKDALEYEKQPYETHKKEFYENIIKNKETYKEMYQLMDLIVFFSFLANNNYKLSTPFMILLSTANFYDDFKKKYGYLKPIYVSIMWTACTVILPCVIHDQDFSILKYPLDYLPCALTLFANSNYADNKDLIEDKQNNVETLPVKYGIEKSNMLSLAALGLSSLIFGMSEHFLNRPLINTIFELQNVGTAFVIANSTNIF